MSDAEWDNDDFEPRNFRAAVSDKWEGEDEDDEVKESWEDDDEEKEKPVETSADGDTNSEDVKAFQKKKKRPIAEIIAEKEAQSKELAAEEKEKEEVKRVKTPVDQAAEKLRQKQLQEESDLKLAKEAFGIVDLPSTSSSTLLNTWQQHYSKLSGLSDSGEAVIDKMSPEGEEDFLKFEQALKDKITTFEKSPHYAAFLDKLFTDLVINVESEEVRKLSATLNSMYHEKLRQQKEGEKKKKKKNKASLKVTRNNDLTDDLGYDDFAEDFM